MVVKISRIPLELFFLNYRAYVKKYYLVSQESFFKIKLFFYLQKTDEKWGQNFQKNFKHLPFDQNKRLLDYCFESSKTIISHLFWFKRDVLNNILTTTRGLAENGPAKTT